MRKNKLHTLVQFRSASECTSQNRKTVSLRLLRASRTCCVGEMAMSVKSLPHKQEDLSSVCRMHIKSQTGGMCLDTRTRETDRQPP